MHIELEDDRPAGEVRDPAAPEADDAIDLVAEDLAGTDRLGAVRRAQGDEDLPVGGRLEVDLEFVPSKTNGFVTSLAPASGARRETKPSIRSA